MAYDGGCFMQLKPLVNYAGTEKLESVVEQRFQQDLRKAASLREAFEP